ncbi:4Fe-4S dicluster domain-containing protein [Clostridium estertheticum]|uniref:Adenylylsulfate reductase n=2 Tax=Clostridium estertheticum TaxID=238834 RepID=A0A1J0GGB4_9CLOT|nr:ferredoxin family protein [Clostridium estertheticum]APC40420.1 adenylylsulfate reductase [Clostridium estertheticum subsp. estertheticum]MBU3075141.1 ferredoxin family protein [Clostridium estertheticum]MBU3165356.1 ferredoxin family protein [Clostridium estertheticum]MBU3173113.1 ferredoxin family protein [Clostridium estertheticum]MBW9152624.1 ferredoxin family protein [Clostridium estertheticum]
MSIKIDLQKCVSCGKCRTICPGNLIFKNDESKAFIKYPDECWGCTACLKECPVQAINYYLGSDIGGKGTFLNTKKEKNLLHWHIYKPNKVEIIITTNVAEANKY